MSIRKADIFLIKKLSPGKKTALDAGASRILALIEKTPCVSDVAELLKVKVDLVIKKALELEKAGIVRLKIPCEDRLLQRLYGKRSLVSRTCKKRAQLWNIVAYEREWAVYPGSFDFLDRASDVFELKKLEKEIYLQILRPYLDALPRGSKVLDAGGGIGRFAVELTKKGLNVQVVDSSERALKKAFMHLRKKKGARFDLHWGNAAHLPMFPAGHFDALVAIELLCYCYNPPQTLKELVRVTKKNGLVVVSVEGKYGGMLSDPRVSFERLPSIFKKDALSVKNNLYVCYYSPASLRRLLEECGVDVMGIYGVQYVTDGVFHGSIDLDKLSDGNYRRKVLTVEKLCRNDPVLKNLARAWVAIGTKR